MMERDPAASRLDIEHVGAQFEDMWYQLMYLTIEHERMKTFRDPGSRVTSHSTTCSTSED